MELHASERAADHLKAWQHHRRDAPGVLAEAAMKRKKGLPGDDEFGSLPEGELDEYSNGEESEELFEDDEIDEDDELDDDDEFDDDLEEDDDYDGEELDDLDADDER